MYWVMVKCGPSAHLLEAQSLSVLHPEACVPTRREEPVVSCMELVRVRCPPRQDLILKKKLSLYDSS